MSQLVLSLLAKNLTATLAFYERLGFRVAGGDCESGWLEVCRDGAVLQFYDQAPIGTLPAPIMSGTIYVYVDDVERVASELDKDIPFEWGPETMEYGNREFAVRDPNGYLIAFSSPTNR